MKKISLVISPVIEIIASMQLEEHGVLRMADWVHSRFPACTPEGGYKGVFDLLPHDGIEADGHILTDNELLAEIAGRKCYNSFAERAGRKSNREYIENTQRGEIPHASILYHPKMSFFIAGVSRRVSHELIRNYVGADRSEEGNPSQESTRFVEHPGFYIVPPRIVENGRESSQWRFFEQEMQHSYDAYLTYVHNEVEGFKERFGAAPKGMDHKRILEAGSSFLHHSVETSFIWTTNPVALAKLFTERCDEGADLEFQRLAKLWKTLSMNRWPNLFTRLSP